MQADRPASIMPRDESGKNGLGPSDLLPGHNGPTVCRDVHDLMLWMDDAGRFQGLLNHLVKSKAAALAALMVFWLNCCKVGHEAGQGKQGSSQGIKQTY